MNDNYNTDKEAYELMKWYYNICMENDDFNDKENIDFYMTGYNFIGLSRADVEVLYYAMAENY